MHAQLPSKQFPRLSATTPPKAAAEISPTFKQNHLKKKIKDYPHKNYSGGELYTDLHFLLLP